MLPGIDDGPRDIEGSIDMARASLASGVGVLVATPHLRSDFPDVHVAELARYCHSLRDALRHHGVQQEIVCGAEVSLSWAMNATDEELVLASYGQRGRDLLIETPPGSVEGLPRLLYELRRKGFRITLAHPERNQELQRKYALLEDLAHQGVLLQINAESLIASPRGSSAARLARHLCLAGLVHAMASDAHRASSWRPASQLSEACPFACELIGTERTAWMTFDVPTAIVGGTAVPEQPAIIRRSRSFAWPSRRR